jgi:CheY-like chemotaxis protein
MTLTVLIADDNPADIDLLQLAFEENRLAADFLTASDGLAAIALLPQANPGLFLIDIKMPRADGFEVLARVRGERRFDAVPAIIMSSSAAAEDRERAFTLGATRYWVKPARFHESISLVATLPSLLAAGRPWPPV